MANKPKKKSGKKTCGSTPPRVSYASLLLNAAVIAAGAAAVFALKETISPGALLKYAASVATGLLTGFSGNPLIAAAPESLAAKFGVSGTLIGHLPTRFLAGGFSPEFLTAVLAILMAAVTLRDGLKKKWLRYESALLIPATAIPGIAFAAWADRSGTLFREISSGFFNSPYPAGFAAAALLALGVMKLATRSAPPARHWAWSLAMGPLIGFWAGYLGDFWPQATAALLYFAFLFVLNESELGAIAAAPVAVAPIWLAKILFPVAGARHAILPAGAAGIPWSLAVPALLGFAASHLLAVRLAAALPAGARKAVFFFLYMLFFASLLFTL